MSKENDILKEQRRARQSFLELKQMENGEKAPDAKEETKQKEKLSDYWYYYRIPAIIVFFVAAIIAVSVNQCVNRENYDMEIALYSYHAVNTETEQKITEYIESKTEDLNGDGKVKIAVINCTYEVGISSAEYQNTMGQKLQSIIAGNTKAMLFIVNREVYEYLNGETEILIDPVELGEDFYLTLDKENREVAEEGLLICKRKVEGTFMEKSEEAKKYEVSAEKILKAIREIN